jgi:hypothetical protein
MGTRDRDRWEASGIRRQWGNLPVKWKIVPAIRAIGCGFLWIVPVAYIFYSLFILWWINSHSYADLLHGYSVRWPQGYDVEELGRKCFTVEWYDRVRANTVLWTAGLLASLGGWLFYSRSVWLFFGNFFQGMAKVLSFMIDSFRKCSRAEKTGVLALFGAILAYRIYFFIVYTPQTDETFSYLFFVRQGLLLTAASYPSTNNHIFYNLVCALLDKAHLLSPIAVMRLPNMAGDLILFYGIFCVAKYWGGFRRATAVVAGVAFCHMISYYAVIGRGYQWQEICAVISGLACWGWMFGGMRKSCYPLFVVSSVVGSYINPLFIYHLLALFLVCVFLLIRQKEYRAMRIFVRSWLLIGIMVGILYLPLILGSSWRALTNNEFVEGWESWGALWGHFWMFTYALKFVSGYGTAGMYGMLAIMILCLYLYFRRGSRGDLYDYAGGYFIATILAMGILIIYKRVYPQERSLCSWQLAVNILFINICYDALNFLFRKRMAGWLAVFLLIKIGGSVRGLYWKRFSAGEDNQVKVYREVEKDWKGLAAIHPNSWQITDYGDWYSLFGRLFLIRSGEGEKMLLNRKKAVGDVLFLPDIYAPGMSLTGYRLWADKRATAVGDSLNIFVLERHWKTRKN